MDSKNKLNLRILSIDIVVYLVALISFIFITKTMFVQGSAGLTNKTMAYYLPIFILTVTGFSFCVFVEYKRNSLKFRNVMFLLAIFSALFNLIAVLAIPSNFVSPFKNIITFTLNEKLYAALYGFIIGIIIVIYFVLLPKKILSVKHLSLTFFVLIAVSYFFIISSLFVDKDTYKLILTFKFDQITTPLKSIIGEKNFFGQILFVGIGASFLLSLVNNKIRYILFSIPMILVIPFTSCKIGIISAIIVILSYVIIKLIPVIKSSKQNIIVFFVIFGFVVFIGSILLVLTINSQTGLLFKIKTLFEKFISKSKDTFISRTEIWRCSFILLGPVQILFGCGNYLFNKALHFTYLYNPQKLEDATNIYHSHNFIVECIGEGGILFLIIVLALYVYLFYLCAKLIKVKKQTGIMLIVLLSIFVIYGMFEPIFILGCNTSVLFSFITLVPIICLYCCYVDKEEINIRIDVIKNAKKIKNIIPINLYQKIEFLHYKLSAKYINKMYKEK